MRISVSGDQRISVAGDQRISVLEDQRISVAGDQRTRARKGGAGCRAGRAAWPARDSVRAAGPEGRVRRGR